MRNTLLILSATALLYGCGDNQVRTYQAPKEAPVVQPVQEPVRQPVSAPAPAADRDFEAELPEGWTEIPGSGMRIVSYSIEGTSIDFYLISLSMGDVPSNVNRWRRQVGLPEATAEAIDEDVEVLKVDGHEVKYIEIYNEDGGRGIIAAIIDFSPTYWYFTAKGTVDELKNHAPEIRSFLNSLNFQ